MNSVHMFGMGFTQTFDRMNGQVALYLKALDATTRRNAVLAPFHWKADPREACGLLRQIVDKRTRIYGYFYSWGAGAFYRRLVKHMEDAGLSFEAIVLCDPVWRTTLLPGWIPINPTSLFPFYRFVVPPNVRRVYVFRQQMNRPCGHVVTVEDPRTTRLISCTTLNVRHERMEDQPEYHAQVIDLVAEAVSAPARRY